MSAVLLVGGFALGWSGLQAFRGDIASYHQAGTSAALAGASVDSRQAFIAAVVLVSGAGFAVLAAVVEKERFGGSPAAHPVVHVTAHTLAGVGILMGVAELLIGIRMGSPGWAVVCQYGC
ncbi:MAG TPA: hypothetical protein VGN81_38210 [Pseudonocardiaceae bacterium]